MSLGSDHAIPGVPSLDLAPSANVEFDPSGAALTPEDYYVLTRCDGRTSFRQIVVIVGLPEAQVVASLVKLRAAGAILLPGEPPRRRAVGTDPSVKAPAPGAAPAPAASPQVAQPAAAARAAGKPASPRPAPPTVPPLASAPQAAPRTPPLSDEAAAAAMREPGELSEEQRLTILRKHRQVAQGTLFDVLELPEDADKKTLKRAYFKTSKEFHPDRFYGKQLGTFQQRLAEIFKAVTDAYQLLEDDAKRAAYLAKLHGGPARATGGQTRGERALEIFERACQMEVTGQLDAALPYFAAAVNLDPQPRHLKRAAEACLRAKELSAAGEYAKKLVDLASQDASAHRVLAKVLKAQQRIPEALVSLRTANAIDPENVHIADELAELERLPS